MNPSATRVLIVDDDRDISALLSALMNREGLTNMMAHDGETALRMVPVARPDMLLVDVKMPGLDGMTVLKRVKETDPHLPWSSSPRMPRFPPRWRLCGPGPSKTPFTSRWWSLASTT